VPRAYATQIALEGGGARDQVATSTCVFVAATTQDGMIGWGEISDIPRSEEQEFAAACDEIPRLLLGRDPHDLQSLHADLQEQFPHDAARELPRLIGAGLDMVCYDLIAQAAGVPIYKLLGGAHRDRVHISWVAFIREDLDLLRQEIVEKVSQGFNAFKLKVGVDIDLDDERLAVLRETAGPQANIKIDPNGGWGLDAAVQNIKRLSRHDISGVETPVAGRDAREIAIVRQQVDVPLIEHVFTAEDALQYLKHESLDCFNIATTGSGGIWPARIIAEMARVGGVGILLGSTVEMGPGTLAQLHLAASIPNLTLPSDLVGPALYAADVLTEPLHYDNSYMAVPSAAGLGGTVDREKLRAL
jgi:muconate cycloisomerase